LVAAGLVAALAAGAGANAVGRLGHPVDHRLIKELTVPGKSHRRSQNGAARSKQ